MTQGSDQSSSPLAVLQSVWSVLAFVYDLATKILGGGGDPTVITRVLAADAGLAAMYAGWQARIDQKPGSDLSGAAAKDVLDTIWQVLARVYELAEQIVQAQGDPLVIQRVLETSSQLQAMQTEWDTRIDSKTE